MTAGENRTARFGGRPVEFVIDVRSKLEHWMGSLPGSICIPVDRMPEGVATLDGVTKQSRIMVYCASGNRSAVAASLLTQAGYVNVVDGGGIGDARAAYAP